MARTPNSVRDHSRTLKCQKIAGADVALRAWTADEERLLSKAMRRWEKKVAKRKAREETHGKNEAKAEMHEHDIPWAKIAARVGTRTDIQCRRKWYCTACSPP